MSVKTDEVIMCATQAGIPSDKIAILRKELEELEAAKKEERESSQGPKSKNEFVVLVRGTPELAKELQQAFIVQVKEGDDVNTLVDRMKAAAKEQNETTRKPKWRIHTWADLFSNLKRKFSKAQNFQPKTTKGNVARVVVLEKEYINE